MVELMPQQSPVLLPAHEAERLPQLAADQLTESSIPISLSARPADGELGGAKPKSIIVGLAEQLVRDSTDERHPESSEVGQPLVDQTTASKKVGYCY